MNILYTNTWIDQNNVPFHILNFNWRPFLTFHVTSTNNRYGVGVLRILVLLALTNIEAYIFETRYSKKRLNYVGQHQTIIFVQR
jgi:hypothetical protein